MTAPDGTIPGGAANYGSLAEFAARTEQDWLNQMEGAVTPTWQAVLDGLFGDLTRGQPFVLAIFEALAKALGLQGVWDTLEEVLEDIGDFVTGSLQAVGTALQQLLDGIWSVFGGDGTTGHTVAQALAQLSDWVSTAFGGLTDLVQEIIDGISGVWLGQVVSGQPVQDLIDAIGGIFGVSQSAAAAAQEATMGVAAIKAEMAGGSYDEFNYPLANELPADKWDAIYVRNGANTSTWGPDGKGVLTWRQVNAATGFVAVHYRRKGDTLTGTDGTVSIVLAKAPGWDLITKAEAVIAVQMSPTDKSCFRARVRARDVVFQSVDATGTITDIGSTVTIAEVTAGETLEVRYDASKLYFYRSGVLAHSVTYTPHPTNRAFGFGAYVPSFAWLWGHPAPEFRGISWHSTVGR